MKIDKNEMFRMQKCPAARIFRAGRNSICRWNERFSELKETLFIYSLCNVFFKSVTAGDELYVKIKKNVRPSGSEGLYIVLRAECPVLYGQQFRVKKKHKYFDFNRLS